jgi:superfamily II DNA/RNA helicase
MSNSINFDDFKEDTDIEIVNDFDDMGLKEPLLRGIYGYGFEVPSDIQKKGIVLISKKEDIIVQSRSGTGKTGTFIIGLLNIINETLNECQAIVLVPTRELAIQVADVCKNLGLYTNIKPVLCVGGSHVDENRRELECKFPKIIIGTPGRVQDIMNRKYFNEKFVASLVMDEADELLSQGFISQVRSIIRVLPKTTSISLFSATLSEEVKDITLNFMSNPKKILVKHDEVSLEGIRQFYILTNNDEDKYGVFKDLFSIVTVDQTMVYVNSKKSADMLQSRLTSEHYSVSVIHSQMSSTERSDVMEDFRNGRSRVLISTDLLARGIDVQRVSVVINYEIPYKNMESYIHRVGRSGRFGRKGTAINIVSKNEYSTLEKICSHYGASIVAFPSDFADF